MKTASQPEYVAHFKCCACDGVGNYKHLYGHVLCAACNGLGYEIVKIFKVWVEVVDERK